jgi:predicted nucleotidyltransferase
MNKDEIILILRRNYDFFVTEFNVSRIGIFGSAAKDLTWEHSDLDIFVEFKKPIGFKFIKLVDYLENMLGEKVDILTKDGIENIRVKSVAQDIERNLIYV